jgi:gliding motility-associated-like protein
MPVHYTNTGTTGAGWTYNWNFGAGATPATSTLENPTGVIYSTPGSKLVQLTVTNGICSNTIVIPLDINVTPTVTFTSNAPQCQDAGVNFTNTGTTGIGVTYFWDFGNGAMPQTSSAQHPTGVMYATPGTKTVTLTIANGFCSATATNNITINETPVANFTNTAPECTGMPVHYTNTGTTGAGWAYNWNFGAGATPATSTLENPAGVIYSTPGNKLVQLTVTNGICSNTIIIPLDINVTPTVTFTSNAPQCQDAGVNFTNTGTTGIGVTYYWDFGNGAMPQTSTAQNPSGVMYATPGIKTVTLTIANGFCSATATNTITIHQTPVVNFTHTAPECTGMPVHYTNTGTTGAGWTYNWNFGAGATPATSTLENPTGVIYSTPGSKLVLLTISNANCSNTIIIPVDINQTPAVSFTSNAPQCQDAGVNFTNTGATGLGVNYFWDFGNGAMPQNSSAQSPTGVMYSIPGTKTVTLTISTAFCSATATNTITINQTPVANFTHTAPECTGMPVHYTNTGTTGAGWTYNWNFGAGATPATSTLENPTGVIYSTPGSKLVQLTISNASCSKSITIPLVIHSTPNVTFTSNAPQCQDAGVNFTNTGTTGIGVTYYWDFGNGAMPQTSTAQNPTGVMYATPGTKTVTLTIANGFCSATATNTITINQTPVANFTHTAPECTGMPVHYTNTGTTGAGWTYNWNFGAGATPATSTLENPTGIIYSTPGSKLVQLTISNATCSKSIIIPVDINQTPAVSFTSNAPQCQDAGVNFTNTGAIGLGVNYFWDFGNGAMPQNSSAQNPTGVMYSTPGTKTVTLTISTAFCSATATNTITIHQTPVANFTHTGPECTGMPVHYTNTGTTGAGWTYNWNFGAGATPATSTLENPTGIIYSTPGSKLVQLTISNATCSKSIIIPVEINLTPTSTFSSNAPQCQDIGVNFTNTGSTGFNWNYFWDFGPGAVPQTSTSENPTGVKYLYGGQKTITFTINNGFCTATGTGTISIHDLPVADAGDDTTICADRSVMIGTPGLTNHTYSWFPAGTLDDATLPQPTASPVAPITQYIVKVTDGTTGCVNHDTIVVTMLAPLVAIAGNDVEICLYDVVQIGAGLIEGQIYTWLPITGLSNPGIPNPMASPDTTTLYTLTVTGTANGCDPVTDQVLVTVHPLPDANAGPDDTITTATSAQLFATGGLQYQWWPGYELSNPWIHNPVASPKITTEYVVLVTDVYGCKNTDTMVVVVYEVVEPYWLPTAFTPNNDGHNDILYVRGDQFETFQFMVYSRKGELIFYTEDIAKGWNGRRTGTSEEAPADGYLWQVKGKLKNGESVDGTGIINLIR